MGLLMKTGTDIEEILANSQNGVIEVLKVINSQNKKRDEKMLLIQDDLKESEYIVFSPFMLKYKSENFIYLFCSCV